MLSWSAGILAAIPKTNRLGDIHWTLNNSLLNTFSIHARNLVDFLYLRTTTNRDQATDIILEDFVNTSDIASYLLPITTRLKDVKIKANKQVAHLTKDRIAYEISGKHWEFIEITRDIRNVFTSITPYISDTKISSQLRERLSDPKKYFIPLVVVSVDKCPSEICISLGVK